LIGQKTLEGTDVLMACPSQKPADLHAHLKKQPTPVTLPLKFGQLRRVTKVQMTASKLATSDERRSN